MRAVVVDLAVVNLVVAATPGGLVVACERSAPPDEADKRRVQLLPDFVTGSLSRPDGLFRIRDKCGRRQTICNRQCSLTMYPAHNHPGKACGNIVITVSWLEREFNRGARHSVTIVCVIHNQRPARNNHRHGGIALVGSPLEELES